MGLTYQYCKNFIGQAVVAHCVGGRRYYGVVETVNSDHIVLRGIDPRKVGVKANTKKMNLERSGKHQTPEFETVQYYGAGPYSGYYVLPLYTLLALSLFFI